jgi:hypothetical protein
MVEGKDAVLVAEQISREELLLRVGGEVVARPTAEALLPDCIPIRHPAPATIAPKNADLMIPTL